MEIGGIEDYLTSEEARKEYLKNHPGGALTRAESTFNLAAVMTALMKIVETIGTMEGQTPESRAAFVRSVEAIRNLHRMLIVNSGASPEAVDFLLKQAGHAEGGASE